MKELSPKELKDGSPIPSGEEGVSGEDRSGMLTYEFNEAVHDLGIGILHLGAKTKLLETAGYRTIGDISSAQGKDLLRLPSMGRATYNRIMLSLRSLHEAQDDSGQINWDRYCRALSIPLLPSEHVAMDGNTFAAMFGSTLGQLGRTLHDPVLQKIISERISKAPHQRATLEEIASSLPEPVTRERIRQREVKFLEALSAALVEDDYARLKVHFRPEFAAYWKRAAEHFDDASEEISFAALVDGLIDTWGTDRAVLLEHLPLIATVITGEIMSVSVFGDATRLDARLLTLSEADRNIPLRHLQIGRAANILRRQGLDTIGDLISSIRTGHASRASGTHYRTAIAHLDRVAESLDEDQRFDLGTYIETTKTRSLPSADPASATEFMRHLSSYVSEILVANPPRMRSSEIFVLRTARPAATRLTLEKTAEALHTYAPSIKKDETETLAWLNEVILEGDQALAGLVLRPVFVKMWQRINELFDESNGDAELFQRYLSATFGIDECDVEPAMPTMIAILTGYPYGRLRRYTRMVATLANENDETSGVEENEVTVNPPVRIKLKGFRKTH